MGQKQSVPHAGVVPGVAQSGNDQESTTPPQKSPPIQPIIANKSIAAAVESRSNPSAADAANHNFGQPLHRSSTSTDEKSGASKLVTDCRVQQRASLACIEENYHNKNEACAGFFEAYKKCRREEHERKLEANARASAW